MNERLQKGPFGITVEKTRPHHMILILCFKRNTWIFWFCLFRSVTNNSASCWSRRWRIWSSGLRPKELFDFFFPAFNVNVKLLNSASQKMVYKHCYCFINSLSYLQVMVTINWRINISLVQTQYIIFTGPPFFLFWNH